MGASTRRRAQSLAMVVLAMVSVTALLAYAVLADGYPVRKVDLNDSGIWVTSNSDATFGRFNKSASFLDAYFSPPGGAQGGYDLDVLQDQGSVVARDVAGGSAYPVDVSTGRSLKDAGADLPGTTVVEMAGGTIAALDPLTGKVWAMRYDPGSQVPALSPLSATAAPMASVGAPPKGDPEAASFSALAVGVDGGVHVVTRAGRLVTIPVSGGAFAKPVTSTVADQLGVIDVSAIGPTAVVLDVTAGTVYVGAQSTTVQVEDDSARLQTPVSAGGIAVAASNGLYAVDATGSTVKTLTEVAGAAPAAPVEASGCLWAAWAGTPGTVVRSCNGAAAAPVGIPDLGTLSRPVFRVNRGVAVLNDVTDGGIVDFELNKKIDPWQDVRPPDVKAQDQAPQKQQVEDKKNKPKAVDDDLGARPGLTTILHVLDNDSNPTGGVLSISAVTAPGNPNAKAVISPDGQTIRYTLGREGGDSEFQYDLSNGVNVARGTVRVTAASGNEDPKQREVEPTEYTVVSGGTIPLPVIDSWRDRDGDPVTIERVATPDRGSAVSTPDGHIEFSAPGAGKGGTVRVDYTVTDGRGTPQKGSVEVTVQPGNATEARPALTKPDVARGEARRPIDLAPLTNDTQGSDPLNPKATMVLAEPVSGRSGITVETDEATGRVVAVAQKPGTYFLDYAAAYGSAPIAKGSIRVDALKPGSADKSPVAMPDHAAVHGQAPVLVDVLANDVDPAGGMLTVSSATADDPNQVRVAVLKGRWLRVMPTTASFDPSQQVIHYTVTSGGSGSADAPSPQATGDLVVTQLPAIENDPPVTRPDSAVVRDGDSVLVPVLDNDATQGGQPLSLSTEAANGAAVGTLQITDESAKDQTAGDVGTAYVVGDKIRYVAPAKVSTARTLRIEYTALSGDLGGRGVLDVTVNPQPATAADDQAPSAKPLEARVVAGETYTIDVESSGNDPDGDSTAVAGIATAPTLGRVVGTTPTGIRYEAYPTSSGLDSFSYTITDRYGKQSTSLVRVAVTPPGLPQAAVPVPDSVFAAPGTTVTVAPLANDFYARTDPVRVRGLKETNNPEPDDAVLDPSTNTVTITTPSDAPATVSYGITGNGGPSEPSEIVVHPEEGFVNPPRVFDQVAKADGPGMASAEVLASAYDPDGDTAALSVSKVHVAGSVVVGGKISVPTKPWAQTVPFEVVDESDAVSAAVLHVPAALAPGPYVPPDALVRVDSGKSVAVKVSDVVADGQDKPVTLTTTDRLWASPKPQVSIQATGKDGFTVTGAKGYVGPGAVTLEVTNGKLGDATAITRVLTIRVQVGPETPVVRCPPGALTVTAGGAPLTVEPMSLCSVWTPTDEMAASLRFGADWDAPISDVAITGSGSRSITIDPSGEAKPGATGSVRVSVLGTKATPSTLKVKVVAARPPTLAPIELSEVKAGESRTVDVFGYLKSDLKDAQPTVVSVTQVAGQKVPLPDRDGSKITITPGASSHGPMVFKVVASDVAEPGRTDRQASGTISFEVFGVPDTPARPQPGSSTLTHSAVLSWPAPAANGARIKKYEVKWSGGQQTCPASPCTIKGLDNGVDYSFSVAAENKAGLSKWSAPSAPYKPNEAPKAVPNFRQIKAEDGKVILAWGAAAVDGSDVTSYVVAVNGRQRDFGRALSGEITGLENGPKYTFTIFAKNEYRAGPSATTRGSAAGTPLFAGPVSFGPVAPADADSTAVKVVWPAGQPNGPSPLAYTVTRTTDGHVVCADVDATSCTDGTVQFGSTYTYSVVARTSFLGVPRTSPPQSAEITPIGTPGKWQAITAAATGANQAVKVTFAVPPSRGKVQSTVAILVNGSAVDTFSASAAGEATQSRTISVPSNGVDYSIQMRVCNEADNCSESNTVSANAYGPIPAPGISLSKDGPTTFQVHVTANGNGRRINLHVWTDSGRSWDVSTTGSNSWNLGQYGVSYSQSDRAHVTITDTAGRSVPGQVDSNTETASPPPGPDGTVTQSGNSVVLHYSNFGAKTYNLRCWQVSQASEHNWSTNFLGSVDKTLSGSGTYTFQCPTTPAAGKPFSLEVYNMKWLPAITWQ